MTDDELKDLVASLAIAQKETSEQMRKTDAKLESIGIQLGNMSKNQGDVAEEFFYNSLVADAHLGSIHFDEVLSNMKKHSANLQEEYDIVLTNGESVGIVEVKYKAHQKDIDKLERKMSHFKELFPWFKNYKLYGALASFHVHEVAKKEALDRGFFVLQRTGDVLHTESGENLLVM